MKSLILLAAASLPLGAQIVPRADSHQHLFSPAVTALITKDSSTRGILADDLIAMLDSAGIRRALVLSMGYTWGSANRTVQNEYEKVRAENDWVSAQVSRYPDRLRAFCSFNPRKPYALDELARCAQDPQLRNGLKLHLGNSDVDLDNPENVAAVRAVFAAANERHMPIVVHMHTSISRKRNYGRAEALVFLNQLLSAAPDVPVQIAHLAGSGGFDDSTNAALGAFVDAIAAKDPRVNRVWFDATTVVQDGSTPADKALIAERIRQLGVSRVLYGSDAHFGGNPAPREGWALFQTLPLTKDELRTIAENTPPYMRW